MKSRKAKSPSVSSLRWIVQGPRSSECGAVAILNARIWKGERLGARDVRVLARKLGITQKNGISGSALDRYIRKRSVFGVGRKLRPTWKQIHSYLQRGNGVIVRYRWKIGERNNGHYAFLVLDEKKHVIIANPHRLNFETPRDRCRKVSRADIRNLTRRIVVGRRQYPMIWVIDRS